jgi:hypothetical protein
MLGTPASGTPVVLGTALTSNLVPLVASPVHAPSTANGPIATARSAVVDHDATTRLQPDHDATALLRGPASAAPPPLTSPSIQIIAPEDASMRAVSLPARPTIADGRDIPRKWIVIGGFVIVGMLIVALVILASHSSSGTTTAPAVPPATDPAKTAPPSPASTTKPAVKPAAQVQPDAAPASEPTIDPPDPPPPPPPPPPKKKGGRPRPAGH